MRNMRTQSGFSLVELLFAMFIAVFVGLAGYTVFSSSNVSYQHQEQVSEMQQNARVAMEMLANDMRGAGFGLPTPPYFLTFGGQTYSAPITYANSATAPDSITILGIGYQAGTLLDQGGVIPGCNNAGDGRICLNSVADFFNATPAFIPTRWYISIGGAKYFQLAAAGHDKNDKYLALGLPATLDRDYADGTPVYIIQAVTYSIDANSNLVSTDLTTLRGAGAQTVAENIEDLQLAYGLDANVDDVIDDDDGDGNYTDADFRFSQALDAAINDTSSIIAMRINITARTRNTVTDSAGSKRLLQYCAEDRTSNGAVCEDPNSVSYSVANLDGFRRRLLTKIIKVRNAL